MSGLPHSKVTSEQILATVLKILDDNKAEDVVQIDLRGKTSVCDHMVICSGRSSRQVVSIADKLAEDLKHELGVLSKSEGQETGDWPSEATQQILFPAARSAAPGPSQPRRRALPFACGRGSICP